MLNKLLFFTLLFEFSCNTSKQLNGNCIIYHDGTFIQNRYNNSSIGHWSKLSYLIIRKDSIETIIPLGYNPLNEDTSYFKINWLDRCSYNSTYIKGYNNWIDSMINNGKYPRNHQFSIVKGTDKYYIQNLDGKKDTLWMNSNSK